jgi:hypothetical protein
MRDKIIIGIAVFTAVLFSALLAPPVIQHHVDVIKDYYFNKKGK